MPPRATKPGKKEQHASKHTPVVHPFDRRHGTDTSGLIPAPVIARGTSAPVDELTAYYGIAPSILQGVIDRWLQDTRPLVSIDRCVFLDVGAGKGRAMLLASAHPFLRVEGVELNPELVAIAQRNIELYRADPDAVSLTQISLHCADATKHPLPPAPTLAFLFHPFEAPVLRRFLKHVERSVKASPRPFDLLYVNAEHGSVLDRHRSFQLVWEGRVPMSAEDHAADLAEIAQQKEYGSTGDELCMIYRFSQQT
jgi:SAM-dependent methyltransferase